MEVLPSYNSELTTLITLSDGEEVPAVTPLDFARFAESKGESFMGANREFMKIFRALGGKGWESLEDARVVDQRYESSTQHTRFGHRTGLGIRVSFFQEVAKKASTKFSSSNSATKHKIEAFNEALFMMPEKRQLLNLLSTVRELKASERNHE